jgi:hypothetical protein
VPIGTSEAHDIYRASRWLAADGAGLALTAPLLAAQGVAGHMGIDTTAWVVVLAVLDALTAPLLFVAGCRLADRGVGTMAGMLYAASPWAWLWGRSPAARELGPVVALLCLGLVSASSWRWRVSIWGCAVAIVWMDLRAWPVLVMVLVHFLVGRPRFRAIGLITAVALVISLPLLWMRAEHLRVGPSPREPARLSEILLGFGVELHAPPWGPPSSPLAEAQLVVAGLAAALIALGVVAATRAARRGDFRGLAITLVLGSTAWLSDAAYIPRDESLILVIPPAVLLMALGARLEPRRIGRLAPRIAAYAIASVALVWFVTLATLVKSAASVSAAVGHPTLGDLTATARAATDAAQRVGADNVIFDAAIVDGQNDQGIRLALPALVSRTIPVRELRDRILPLERPIVYTHVYREKPDAAFAWPSVVFGDIPLGGRRFVRVLALLPRAADEWLADVPASPIVEYADGSRLLGWRMRPPNELATYWRLAVDPTSPDPATRVVIGTADQPCRPGLEPRHLPPIGDRRADEITVIVSPTTTEPRIALVTLRSECLVGNTSAVR